MSDLTLPEAREQRDTLVAKTDVLDKVGVLRALPDDMHVTTEMAAEFYDVLRDTISAIVSRNRDEFESDGYRVVTRGSFEGTYNMSVPSSASRIALLPRRAVLRLGMLLRDSGVARQVRDYLLDAEEVSPERAQSEDEKVLEVFQILTSRVAALNAENKALTSKVEHDAPKVAKAEAHSKSTTSIHRQDFAREVQTWGKKVHGIWILQEHVMAVLAHKGVTVSGDRTDAGQATATAIRNGWAENVKRVNKKTGYTSYTAYLHPKGQDLAWKWITKYVEENGTLELPKELNGGTAA
ncbi:phage antirepressor KilAC domain-containing protein [Prescottella agglutinans]|uniref:Phage antirepressor YoqD-like protein n=1 Tax=Prescottella agglutinans TaxID=1644129 RepID=A0ABT6M584_9NOCA|nr:phage antirepressor KilAC domain-containing protein [Prescottella agglutinans]MDH6279481.1 phage antirepressor YoqD-like protein [Prescottella agglutinans]